MATALTRKDFVSDQEVRWCPGCGDYAILAQVQKTMPEFGIPPHKVVFISGIGCSSRFPYYMNTYGFHTIHGRAPAIATGLKVTRPDLDVWVVTGDGDGLSIGGNHLIHILRRNVDLKILLFNNRIYGLTKGQYSPTSEIGKITKSTPMGSADFPFNPITVALGAHATFVARSIDVEQKHLGEMLKRAHQHRGASFLEILQNCNIYNDGAFNDVSDKAIKAEHQLVLEHGKPLIFGKNRDKGIRMNGMRPEVVTLGQNGISEKDIVVHDETNLALAFMLGNFEAPMPTPVGVFYATSRPSYDAVLNHQLEEAKAKQGAGDLKTLLTRGDTWTVS
jgi:2-oxoglutarate/2-oxoacid ferredoxin oxidoreductase subunit beta